MNKEQLIKRLQLLDGDKVIFELVNSEGDTFYFEDVSVSSITDTDDKEITISLPEISDFTIN